MRAIHWSRGNALPEWDNRLANSVLQVLFSREIDAEVAKLDFQAMWMAIISPTGDPKVSDARHNYMTALRNATKEILNHTIYNPEVNARRAVEAQKTVIDPSEILKKVSDLG